MKVELFDDGTVGRVEGNFCKRGVSYANDECTNPRRTVTSTVRCKSGAIVSVKTDRTVPKAMMFEVMAEINRTVAYDGVKIGDVIISNICGIGANLVATGNAK